MDNLQSYNRTTLLLILLFIYSFSAPAQFVEDFADNDITINPNWIGSLADFKTNENSQLQLNASKAGFSYLATASKAIDNSEWEFYLSFDFNPSSQNFTRIYLTSSSHNLSGEKNGYFVLAGGTNDEISLYKETASEISKIIDGKDATLDNEFNECKIKVTRNSEGRWQLWSAVGDTSQYLKEGEAVDLTTINSFYFGIFCQYTSTRADKFYFDDIKVSGIPYIDTIPPTIIDVVPISSTQIQVNFSEPILLNTNTNKTSFEVIPEIGDPENIVINFDSTEVNLFLEKPLLSGKQYDLVAYNVPDTAENSSNSITTPFSYYFPEQAEFRGIVINEIMADPTPIVGLPEAEFIEIYNTSKKVFDLTDWSISDDNSSGTLGFGIIHPEEHIILSASTDTLNFQKYGKVLGVAGLPSINNTGETLTLRDNLNKTIDKVFFTNEFYKSSIRNQGGYTLEMIDFTNPCSTKENWAASEDEDGGTPGRVNSISATKPDLQGPKLESVFPAGDSLFLSFSENLDPLSVNEAHYFLNDELLNPKPLLDISGYKIMLKLPFNLMRKIKYILEIKNIKDCNGNHIDPHHNKITFSLPEAPDSLDIIINEILFNPKAGGVDFVEVYNNSDKYINLKDWNLANIEIEKESGLPIISNRKIIFGIDYLFAPKQFIAFTTDIADIQKNYPKYGDKLLIKLSGLPPYPNDVGTAIILNEKNEVVDRLDYHENYHSPILQQTDGVSLERISYNSATQDENNWTSAASMIGFATPAAQNSQSHSLTASEATIMLNPKVIIPDNNGLDDFTLIQYFFGTKSYIGSVYVYDINGNRVCTIADNISLPKEGLFKWEGTDDHGEAVKVGIYMVFIELFDLSGKIKVYKEPIAVGTKF